MRFIMQSGPGDVYFRYFWGNIYEKKNHEIFFLQNLRQCFYAFILCAINDN